MQFSKTIVVIFLLAFSSYTFSSSIVESISDIPLKIFSEPLPTATPGQYVEYNQRLLAIRHYNNQGLEKEFSVEMPEHVNQTSAYSVKVFVDKSADVIWVADYRTNNETNEHYLTVDKYIFNDNGFVGDPEKINIPANVYGRVQGFNNNLMYLRIGGASVNEVTHIVEYDLTNDVAENRSITFDHSIKAHLSPNGNLFITDEGIISLTDTEMTFTEVDFEGLNYQAPYFLDNSTVIYENNNGIIIGTISDKAISLTLIHEISSLEFDFHGRYFDASSKVLNYLNRNSEVLKSFSLDKLEGVWQINEVKFNGKVLNSTYGNHNRRTSTGGLIYANSFFTYLAGKWQDPVELSKGLELDKGYVFVSNASDIESNSLYAISVGDVNKLRKLESLENNNYQWRDIAELPNGIGTVKFAMQYQEKIYIQFHAEGDITTKANIMVVNLNGEYIETVEIPTYLHYDFKAKVYSSKLYLTSRSENLVCTLDAFHCDLLMEDLSASTAPLYFNHFLYSYAYSAALDENHLYFYDTRNDEGWKKSALEIPENSPPTIEYFGDNLRLNNDVLVFNESGEVDSTIPITAVNSDGLYLQNYNNNKFKNGKIACDDKLIKCISIKGSNGLNFTSINLGTHKRYKQIQGTPFFYDFWEYDYTLELFKSKDDLLFPEIEEVMPKEIEAWQNEQLSINLSQYFNNISYYEKGLRNAGWPDDEYAVDENGNFSMMLTNEHTWQEQPIRFATYNSYTGFNDNFTMSVPPMLINLRDVNDIPELKKDVSLLLSEDKKDYFTINFNDFFQDPERLELKYHVTNLPLPNGLEPNYSGGLQGVSGSISKAGTYEIEVLATDTSVDELSATFTMTLTIKGSSGDTISTDEKSSSSGGSLGWILLMLNVLLIGLKQPKRKVRVSH